MTSTNTSTSAAKYGDLTKVEGLKVLVNQQDIVAAVHATAYIGNLDHSHMPDAVLIASTVESVQAAVKFCSNENLRISVRSGGHNWQSIWLQGPGSVLLDVGGMNKVAYDEATKTVSVGPGATEVNLQIPDDVFVPTGHCKGVPMGGFILGGGYGQGFIKYGNTSTLVQSVEVVLASGEVKHVHTGDSDDNELSKAIQVLLRGSYHRFPAVITKFVLRTVPSPKCLLAPSYMFPLRDWKKALKLTRDIAHRGDDDAMAFEATLVFAHSPPPLVEATGEAQMVVIAITVWSDDDEGKTKALLQKYTEGMTGTLIPPELEPTNPKTLADRYAPFYPPKMRYYVEAFLGDERFLDVPDTEYEEMLQPIVDMYTSSAAPPPPSHTIVPLVGTLEKANGGKPLVCGFTPSVVIGSYCIYDDAEKDLEYSEAVPAYHANLLDKEGIYTLISEGQIRNPAKPTAIDAAVDGVTKHVTTLDPNGVFAKN